MKYYVATLLVCSIFCGSRSFGIEINNNDSEGLWSTDKGNPQNTYRIVPSMATNYSKLPWTYEYHLTSEDVTEFGRSAGINGDIYFFQSQIRSHPADYMVCLTPNGIVRWTLFVQAVPEMEPIGISNIITDREGTLFYIISWSGDTIYTAKICRITHAQTSHPVQQCTENNQLFMYINTPLALNEKYDLLVAAVTDNEIDSIPVVLDKKTLHIVWMNRHFFGAGMDGQYRCDINMGDIFWIGGDDRLLKFDHNGENLINNLTQIDGFGRDFVLDAEQEIIIRAWRNETTLPRKLMVSSHDVSTRKIKLRWHWYSPSLIAENDDITPPTIDEKGIVYMASMPLAFAIDSTGKTVWTSRLATSSEMETFNLVSTCVTMNAKRRILYIVSASPYYQKSNFLCFITAVNMDTGKVIKRIDLNLGHDELIIPQCPILIGDEMLYFSWLTGKYPEKVPFKVMGIQQL